MNEIAPAIAMIAAFVLSGVGLRQVMRGSEREAKQRGWLMIAAGIVIAGNVVIWTV